jgi:hypothetical protein
MRTWVKATLGGAAVVALAFAVLAGTGAYLVFRHMEQRSSGEADAIKAIETAKARFGPRPPLVEIVDPRRADIRINRTSDPSPARVSTLHVINWKSDTNELTRFEVPLWVMRFSSANIASQLGILPASLRLTVSDIEHYGPGVVVDYGAPGSSRVLVWVE